jgi:hypothetical protein
MPRFMKDLIISTEPTTGALTQSQGIDFEYSYGYCVQVVIAGTTPSATLKVQGSIDEVTWVDISSLTIAAAGSFFDNKDAIYWPKLRVIYDQASGTNIVAKVYINSKGG